MNDISDKELSLNDNSDQEESKLNKFGEAEILQTTELHP